MRRPVITDVIFSNGKNLVKPRTVNWIHKCMTLFFSSEIVGKWGGQQIKRSLIQHFFYSKMTGKKKTAEVSGILHSIPIIYTESKSLSETLFELFGKKDQIPGMTFCGKTKEEIANLCIFRRICTERVFQRGMRQPDLSGKAFCLLVS